MWPGEKIENSMVVFFVNLQEGAKHSQNSPNPKSGCNFDLKTLKSRNFDAVRLSECDYVN